MTRGPHQSRRQILTAQHTLRPLRSEPPAWVERLLPLESAIGHPGGLGAIANRDLLRVRIELSGARAMDAAALSASVRDAYLAIGRFIRGAQRHPVRIWNFVPGIGDSFGALDRYMVFNRGRFEALALLGLDPLPTSSAVGVESDDFVIEALAAPAPGVPVENPRQISSWNYSACYGPRPPCFARATITAIDGDDWLLIGGTASIVGEDSCHAENLAAQLDETLANISAVIESQTPRRPDHLELLEDVRVYVARREHGDAVAQTAFERFAGAREIEIAHATVCRPELLVEIEGRVRLTPRRA